MQNLGRMMRQLRALSLKPQEVNARPIAFHLGEHLEVAIFLRVHQGHHSHAAQLGAGGGLAWRLERFEVRGKAEIRQELAL